MTGQICSVGEELMLTLADFSVAEPVLATYEGLEKYMRNVRGCFRDQVTIVINLTSTSTYAKPM